MVRHEKKSTSIPRGLNYVEGKLFRKLLHLDNCSQGSCKARVLQRLSRANLGTLHFFTYYRENLLFRSIYLFNSSHGL